MRLLDTYTGQFVEKDPRDPDATYAILSHTWDKKEQTYQEVVKIQEKCGDQGDQSVRSCLFSGSVMSYSPVPTKPHSIF